MNTVAPLLQPLIFLLLPFADPLRDGGASRATTPFFCCCPDGQRFLKDGLGQMPPGPPFVPVPAPDPESAST